MEDKTCSICGEVNDDYLHTLKCGHTFHYQCLYLSFKSDLKHKHCPYCRSKNNLLPIVPGLKKANYKIHDCTDIDVMEQRCEAVLKRGPKKGQVCSKNCKLGYKFCGVHFKQNNK